MPTRRVRRSAARPIEDHTPGLKGHLKRFFLSFKPRNFRAYWLSRSGLVRLLKVGGLGVLAIFLVFLWYIPQLPSPSKINSKIGTTTTFYARDELTNPGKGTKLYEVHGDENRIVVNFDKIPENLKHATIAIEDKNFYKEGAFSWAGIIRAAIVDVTNRGAVQGGSTITQQYVKSSLLTGDKRLSRKIKELILSIEINQFYSKNDVLKLYLNEIPYGNQAYGVEAACRTYFSFKYGKDDCTSKVNLGESALLAAIPNAPSYYSPYGENKEDLISRQHTILDKMVEQGYAKQAEAEAAKWNLTMLDASAPNNKALAVNKTPAFYSSITAPNFVNTLQYQREQEYGAAAVEEGGWKVITTLDANLQRCAELSIYNPANESCKPTGGAEVNPNRNNANYKNLQASKGSNAALVAANPKNGQVLAMVGSYSFAESQVNVATSLRQPGSSFKPYVYAALFNKNKDGGCANNTAGCATYGGGSLLDDTVTNFGTAATPYKPQDFGGGAEVGGKVTVRTALAGSLNIPAVQALKTVGTANAISLAHNMGITTLTDNPSNYGLSLVLGSGEVKLADHVNAYESFANGGVHYDPSMVLKITDAKNKIIKDNTKTSTPKQVLDPQVAYMIANIMSDSTARKYVFGTELDVPGHVGGSLAGQGVAVKTGTTEHFNDAWTMGYTPSIVAGVWAGNNNNAPMTSQAADIAAPFWRSFMTAALTDTPKETFAKPTGSKTIQYLPVAGSSSKSSSNYDYYPSWYKATVRKQVEVDKVSGKLKTSCTPPLAVELRYDTGSTDTDDAHACDDAKPEVQIGGASGGGPYSLNISVNLGAFGTNKTGVGAAQLQVYFDDQIVSTRQIDGSGSYPVTYSPSQSGSHTFKAVVTDTGLYQGSDEASVNVTNTGDGGSSDAFSGQTPANGTTIPLAAAAAGISFNWTPAANNANQYTLYIDGSPKATTSGTSMTFPVTRRQVHTWYVLADNGQRTSTLSFTVQ